MLLSAAVSVPPGSAEENTGEASPRAQIDVPLDTVNVPVIDGTIGASEWTSAIQVDAFRAVQAKAYFKANGTTLFMMVDVLGDTTNDNTGDPMEVCLIGLDGEGDGSTVNANTGITYSDNAQGQPTQMPITDPPPTNKCVDRWAQIFGNNTSAFGWMNKDPGTNSAMLWYRVNQQNQPWPPTVDPYDRGAAGFSTHRFYEYSIPYDGPWDELGGSKGQPNVKSITMFCHDARGGATLMGACAIPSTVQAIDGPWEKIKLPMAPKANITSPVRGTEYYQNDIILFDGANSSFETGETLTYKWTFDGTDVQNGKTLNKAFATVGRHDFTLTVTDSRALANISSSYVIIKEKPSAPVLDSFSPPTDTVSVAETEVVNFSVNYHDDNMDVGDRLTCNWTVNDVLKKQAFDGITGGFSIRTLYDGEYSSGDYNVTFTVTDAYGGGSLPVSHSWRLNVTQKNRPPEITAHSPQELVLSGSDYKEDTPQLFTIAKSDPDKDTMTVKWYVDDKEHSPARNKDSFTYLAQPDYNSSGTHKVKVVVSDEPGATSALEWSIDVTNVNRAPRIDSSTPPEVSTRVREGEKLTLSITRSDPDGDPITVKWLVNDLEQTDETGLSFVFKPDFEGDRSSVNSPFTVRVEISDGKGGTDKRSWTVIVEEVNRAPAGTIAAPTEGESFKLIDTVTFDGAGSSDPDNADNSSLTYAWDFGDSKTGTGKQVMHKYDKDGPYKVRMTVSDGRASTNVFVNVTIRVAKLVLGELTGDRSSAIEGSVVNFTVEVQNRGDLEVTGVELKLYIDSRSAGSLITTKTIPRISASDGAQVSFQWTALSGALGTHTIIVELQSKTGVLIAGEVASQATVLVTAKKIPTPPPPPGSGMPWWIPLVIALVAVVAVGAVAGVMLSKKKRRTNELVAASAAAAAAQPAVQAPLRPPKGEVHRKKEKRLPYTGHQVPIYIPGRPEVRNPVEAGLAPAPTGPAAGTVAPAVAGAAVFAPAAQSGPAMPTVPAGGCPTCGRPSGVPGQPCESCDARYCLDRVSALLSSLKGKGLNVLPAERLMYQAQSAYSLTAFNDVRQLCGEAESTARTIEGDDRDARSEISGFEDVIAEAVVEGKDTSAAEGALERANTLLAAGDYARARAEAANIPSLIREREAAPAPPHMPTPPVAPVPPSPAAGPRCPSCGEDIESDWNVCPSCNAALKAPAPPPAPAGPKCPNCGEPVEKEWNVCPSCDIALGKSPEPLRPPGAPPKPPVNKCPKCGEEVEANWKLCPSCNASLVLDRSEKKAACPSCGKDVLPAWSLCPYCDAELRPKGREKQQAGPSAPAPPPPAASSKEQRILNDIEKVEARLKQVERDGVDVKKARNMLELAVSFAKSGNHDKAEKYVSKARGIADALEG